MLPHDYGASITWLQIDTHNRASYIHNPPSYYTSAQVDFLIGAIDLSSKANINSPTFTGMPIAPEPAPADNSQQIATTACVHANGGGIGSLKFDGSKLQHVNCGCFWRANVQYSHFFWEAWVKPNQGQPGGWTGYLVSDNQGGFHNLLWGFSMGTTGRFNITGNLYGSSGLTSFTSAESFPEGRWMHTAVGWDGQHIMLWVHGILCHVQAYTATRFQPGGNNFTLHIGGSDHNNAFMNLAQIRATEGFGRCKWTSDFTPEQFFRPLSVNSIQQRDLPEFCINFQSDDTLYIDTGRGFEGMKHDGVRAAQLGVNSDAAPFSDLDLPTFDPSPIVYGDYTPTAPAVPAGALVWDSFSRPNVTALNTTLAYPYPARSALGRIEAGSLGQLVWFSDSLAFPNATGQILDGKAVMSYNGASALLETGTKNVDIRVDRVPFPICYTSIFFRHKDGNDNYKVFGNDAGLELRKVEGGVATTIGLGVPPAGWKTLRMVANESTVTIYTGTATEGVFTPIYTGAITNIGAATQHGLWNSQFNLKTIYRADNFLIKAA
jgi:hypothetical protein